MKRERLFSCLEGWSFGFLLSFFPVCCLVSAFSLPAEPVMSIMSIPVDMPPWVQLGQLALWCALAALVLSVCFSFRLWYIPPALLLGLGLWQWQALETSLEALLAEITKYYNMAYGWGILRWSDVPLQMVEATPALCMIAAVCMLPVTWAVCRRKRLVWALPVCLLPLCACLVVTDTVPGTAELFALLAACVLLVLTHKVRRRNALEGTKLTAMLLIPVFLGAVLLFSLNPRSTYDDAPAESLRSYLQSWLGMETDLSGPVTTVTSQENLAGMGMRNNPHTPVMDVAMTKSRTLYLRERGYDTYDGKRWVNTKSINIADWTDPAFVMSNLSVTITTRNPQPIQYVPYYAAYTDMGSDEGATANPDRLTNYSFQVLVLANVAGYEPDDADQPDALWLPEAVLEWARPLAEQLTAGAESVDAKARCIQNYVQNSARYDLRTGRMPADETDFARWFLFESDTGYCVHYATAAAVLLRAAGVPAQYVTGYVVPAQGNMATVYRDNAHAWVEYYQPGVGWRILDSTPEGYMEQMQQAPVTTEPTAPSYTAPVFTTPSRPQETEPATEQTRPQTPTAPKPAAPVETASLWWILWIPAAVLAVALQWRLRLLWRNRRLQKGSPNRRAIALWAEAARQAKHLKLPLPSELTELAQKARFSQHTLTDAELDAFLSFLKEAKNRARQRPLFLRLCLRLFHAIY